jgi:hypothetical protein
MPDKVILPQNQISWVFRSIFYFCAFYFFLMGFSLIFFPVFITKGFSNNEINPTIIGMLRGAGGSIIPYSLLYIMIANKPFERKWALYIILTANVIAICLDSISILFSEYKISNAMIDLPIELISISGIIIIWMKIKTITNKLSGLNGSATTT